MIWVITPPKSKVAGSHGRSYMDPMDYFLSSCFIGTMLTLLFEAPSHLQLHTTSSYSPEDERLEHVQKWR